MTIETTAILFQPGTDDKSCANCVYYKLHKALGSMCELHDLPTSRGKCCVSWGGDKIPQPVEEKQGELF